MFDADNLFLCKCEMDVDAMRKTSRANDISSRRKGQIDRLISSGYAIEHLIIVHGVQIAKQTVRETSGGIQYGIGYLIQKCHYTEGMLFQKMS